MQAPKSETVTVTPFMAERWLTQSLYERQRPRAEWNVERLAVFITKGQFIRGSQIHFGILRGEEKLINGQHTLAAIIKTNTPIELNVLYTPVKDEEELGQLYGRHDRHRTRTPHDVFFGMGLSEELQLSEPETNSFGRAIRYILSGFRRLSVTVDAELATSMDLSAEHMKQWAPVAREYFEIVREANIGLKAAYRRAPVVAVGLVTLQAQPVKAKRFWVKAAGDDELSKYDPAKALNNFLRANSSGRGSPITYIRHVAKCWNRHFDDGEIQILRPDDHGKIGVTIKGTSFKAVSVGKARGMVEEDEPEIAAPKPRQMVLAEALR